MTKYDNRRADTDAELLGFERGNGSATTGGPPVPPIVSVALYEEWKGAGASKPTYSMSSWLDAVMHVGFWVFAFVMELLVFTDCDKIAHPTDTSITANKVPFVYAAASLSLMTISFAILLLLLVIHLMTGYSIRNQVDSYLVTIIVAGTKLSFFFVTLIVLFATPFSTASDEWRMRSVLSFIAKGFLIQQLTNNLRQIGSVNDYHKYVAAK